MRKILIIAYAFPPYAGSSGHLRPLALTRYLPQFGWQPLVLSAHPRAFERVDYALNADIPKGTSVTRPFALDARRHLSVRGRYPLALALPDRWSSWWLGAVPAGLWLIRRHQPDVIWSTSPILTGHMIALTLHRLTGVPWVADFRDPVSNTGNGARGLSIRTKRWVEEQTIKRASRSVFTTSGAMAAYADRYPERSESLSIIPNGYDERNFAALSDVTREQVGSATKAITLVHSGILYRNGRNPYAFLSAIASLKTKGVVDGSSLQVTLRASGHEEEYGRMITEMQLDDIVKLKPSISYRDALVEIANADGLLLFQGSMYNRQIPAKVYEYLRVRRPILALADLAGDTAKLLMSEGIDSIAPLDDTVAIADILLRFLEGIEDRSVQVPKMERVIRYSRQAGAQSFAELFNEIAGG